GPNPVTTVGAFELRMSHDFSGKHRPQQHARGSIANNGSIHSMSMCVQISCPDSSHQEELWTLSMNDPGKCLTPRQFLHQTTMAQFSHN
ncbi:MAG: hypothetical protein NTV34_01530, partial [Proteobacteria bacterium]|nr:hypothetical protein [Pseudomonadota bacterium]